MWDVEFPVTNRDYQAVIANRSPERSEGAAKQSPSRKEEITSSQKTLLLRNFSLSLRAEGEAISYARIGDCFGRTHRALAMTGWTVVSAPYGWRDAPWKTHNDTG